jgi:tryptophan synthase beta subunit
MKMPMNEKDQFVTSLRVDPKLWKKTKMTAIACDKTLGDAIDEALREWIRKMEKCEK